MGTQAGQAEEVVDARRGGLYLSPRHLSLQISLARSTTGCYFLLDGGYTSVRSMANVKHKHSLRSGHKQFWWSSKPEERYWCEITDRDELGRDLYCPQSNNTGKPFWSYSLIKEVQPGDIIFHYSSAQHAIVGVSLATAELGEKTISWTPHWTGKHSREKLAAAAKPRPGWVRNLQGYRPLEAPLTLKEIQEADGFIRDWVGRLRGKPLIFLQMYPIRLRALQGGYVTKMPAAFVRHWRKLAKAADSLHASRMVIGNERTADAALSDLLEQMEARRSSSSGKGFIVDPECRKAVEKYAVEKAAAYFRARGFTDISEVGKPYDLHCRKPNGERLFVEVKGTTTDGGVMILTANEVACAHENSMALYLLHDISVKKETDRFALSGGLEVVQWPWQIDRARLKPLAYRYDFRDHL